MTPTARLAEPLADARRSGTAFAGAWAPSVSRALAEADDPDGWLEALEGTRDAWQAAWERRPGSRPERALYAVAADPEREPLPDRNVRTVRPGDPARARPAGEVVLGPLPARGECRPLTGGLADLPADLVNG